MTLVTERFMDLAQSAADARGMPDVPMVTLPHSVEFLPEEELRAVADKAFEEVIDLLTQPRERAGVMAQIGTEKGSP